MHKYMFTNNSCWIKTGSGIEMLDVDSIDCCFNPWGPNEVTIKGYHRAAIEFDKIEDYCFETDGGTLMFFPNNKGEKPMNPMYAMPNIISHKYLEKSGTTIIEWSDGTKTSVTAENPETADKYVGFEMAIAKKAMGNNNKFNNLADYWLVKKPKKDAAIKAKLDAEAAEKKRIEENHRIKIQKYLVHKEALRLKREYEAKRLASEKYGVPFDNAGVK